MTSLARNPGAAWVSRRRNEVIWSKLVPPLAMQLVCARVLILWEIRTYTRQQVICRP